MVTKEEIRKNMQKDAHNYGYYLCPDADLLDNLIDGLVTNEQRYGYGSCPCRIGCGNKTYDSDIICPCEYRDADVDEFGMCYCGLFVNKAINDNPKLMAPIPERRPIEVQDAAMAAATQFKKDTLKPKSEPQQKKVKQPPVWRCTVCGYLCARETPPPICPICKAKAERFEHYTIH